MASHLVVTTMNTTESFQPKTEKEHGSLILSSYMQQTGKRNIRYVRDDLPQPEGFESINLRSMFKIVRKWEFYTECQILVDLKK
jgi:hypothetical protein